MRLRSLPVFVIVIAVGVAAPSCSVPTAHAQTKDEELARARMLDHEGVRAYREGRYKDAIRYFSEALKLGGPASEVWNIAKCHIRLDEPEQASEMIQRYLALPGLSPEDRAEASEQAQELQRRRSPLTVSSSPSGATVYLDGKRDVAGTTPLSIDIAPGAHAVAVEAQGYRPYSTQVTAHFGRAVIVDAQLAKGSGGKTGAAGTGGEPLRRISLGAQAGGFLSKLGGYSGVVQPGFALLGTYFLFDTPDMLIGAGARMLLSFDGWSNSIGASNTPANCTSAIPESESATEVSGFAMGTFAYRLVPRLRVGADLGLGFATFLASQAGGDVFIPTCAPSFGLKPALHVGTEISYSILPLLRAVVVPMMLEVHPAFDGTRNTPVDTSAPWLRFGMALGVAVDL